ncbi:MAG: TonB-dependent receptor [Acidobacteria bacterium]|nr:TonB-dependent receptor [Acidobacteriota bacterium]
MAPASQERLRVALRIFEGASRHHAYLRAHLDTRGGEPGAPTRIELTTGGVSGSPPLANRALRTRHSFQAALQPAAPRLFARDHQFTLAAEWQAAGMRNRYTAPGGVHAVTAEGEPAFVVELNTPARSHSRVQTLSLALEDRLALTGWLAVEAGIRLDSARGAEPASLSWHHLAPRVGLALTLARLALRGGYARAYAPLAGRYLDFASPDSLSGLEYRWVDANGDRRFQPRERGELLRRFGGAYSSISSRLRRPFADEFTVSAEVSLPARSFARVGAFRREDKYRLAVVNPPVFLSYLPPRIIQDPGPDFINGTFDDQQVLVWEQDPATFGADRFLLRSTPAPLLAAVHPGSTHAQRGSAARSRRRALRFSVPRFLPGGQEHRAEQRRQRGLGERPRRRRLAVSGSEHAPLRLRTQLL